MPLGLGVSRQPAAFLRKSPVFRCCFHAGITGRSTAPFRMHGGHAGGTVSPAAASRLSVCHPWRQSKNPAEWPGRGPETRSHSGRGDAAEGPAIPIHSRALSSARERALIFYLEGLLGGGA